jgi:hypothetical protein
MISLQLIKESMGSEMVLSLVLALVMLSLQILFCQISGRPLSWTTWGSNGGRGRRFFSAFGPTQSPVQWVTVPQFFPRDKATRT